jgi:hypothetical protein
VVVDTSALLAILLGEPERDLFIALLAQAQDSLRRLQRDRCHPRIGGRAALSSRGALASRAAAGGYSPSLRSGVRSSGSSSSISFVKMRSERL